MTTRSRRAAGGASQKAKGENEQAVANAAQSAEVHAATHFCLPLPRSRADAPLLLVRYLRRTRPRAMIRKR